MNSSNLVHKNVVFVPDCKQSKCPRILIRVRVTEPDACETKTERHVVLPAKLVCVTENYSNLEKKFSNDPSMYKESKPIVT